jgi:PAS domain S-box-containing protein
MDTKEKVNILMVDDQPGKLLSYEVILGELEENLIKATSGKEALECLLKNDIAVVLMDVSMPVMNGFELAEMIREHPRFKSTAIIFISAVYMTDLDRLKGYERGAVDYISVPVIPELLRAKVSVFAELHRKTQQLAALNRELEQRVLERTEELESKAEALLSLNIELGRKNQELDAIVRTAPDFIFSRRTDGARDYISDRFYEYTGAQLGSANGFGWLDYVHPEDKQRSMDEWVHCAQSGENYESEYRMRGKDGLYRWFRARAVPLRDDAGTIVRWYGTCSDIHDSKVLEQSIRNSAIELEKIVDKRTNELRRLTGRLMTMQDEERRRIARELHDGLGQELVAAKMLLDRMQQQLPQSDAAQTSGIIDRAIKQIRSVSHLLHPPLLDEVGLLSALQWFLEGLSERSGIKTVLEIVPTAFPRLAPSLETAVFRIIQEALTNVFRHSGALKACVRLVARKEQLIVAVQDDGKGIEENVLEMRPGSIGIGIAGMRQRVKEFGGELRLSNTYPGTLVEAVVPLDNLAAHETHVSEFRKTATSSVVRNQAVPS